MKKKNEVYRHKKHRDGLTAKKSKRSRTHTGLTYIAGRRQMKTKHQYNTKSHTLLLISHYQLVRYESSCGHNRGSCTKTNRERTRSEKTKQNKTNTQGRKQTEGSGRESSLQRTSSPGRDSGWKKPRSKRQTKAKKQRTTAY